MPTIVPVVEGPGEVAALPALLSRILLEYYNRPDVLVAYGKRGVVSANGLPKLETQLAKFLQHAQNKPDCDAILVLLDADNDCPVILSQELSQHCEQVGTKCPVQIVCARRSYESWFLASLDTVKGKSVIPDTATLSGDAENVPNPKQWITALLPRGQAYKETTHQAALSSYIDLDLAHKNSRSFRRLCHALEQLLDAIDSPPD